MWLILWRSRWTIIIVTGLFIALSVPYALAQTEWYRAEALLAPAEERSGSSLSRQFGGLATLAGVNVGGGDNSVEALAILQSRDFTAKFIEEEELLKVIFAEAWDDEANNWLSDDPASVPDMRDAVRLFRNDVISVAQDSVSGLVTLRATWTDPKIAAEWVDKLVRRLNEHLRNRALVEANSNVKYLESEMMNSNVVVLQQSIGSLLEQELQKVMLARGNEEFAFRVIDSPQVPKQPVRPNRPLIVIIAMFLGGMLSVLFVYGRHAVLAARSRSGQSV